MSRPSWDEYFRDIVLATKSRSPCERLKVGCLLVKNNRIVSQGYNGFLPGCEHKSIVRNNHEQATVHAEQNAVALAARHGTSTDRAIIYSTLRPCFGCAKEMIQAGVAEVVYQDDIGYDAELESVYAALIQEAGLLVRRYSIDT